MSSRGTRPVLRGCDHALQSVVRKPQGRRLSNTRAVARYGPVPEFHKVSNPELATVLENYRNTVVMPQHLAKQQRDMINKPKYIRQLEIEPVIANLSGEEFVLQHLKRSDRASDLKTFVKTLTLTTPEEWDNMPRVLTALKTGKFNIMRKDYPMRLITSALKADRLDVIVRCLTFSNKTGLHMRTTREAVVVLRAFCRKAEEDSTSQDMERTKRWIRSMIYLMSIRKLDSASLTKLPKAYNEMTNRYFAAGQKYPDVSPEVVGAILEIFAIRATKFQEGVDKDGQVLKWARKMISLSQATPRQARPVEVAVGGEQDPTTTESLHDVEEQPGIPTQPKVYELKYNHSNFMPFHIPEDIEVSFKANPDIQHPTEFMVVAWLSHRLSILNGLKLASKVLAGKPEAEVLDYLCKKLSRNFYKLKGMLYDYAKQNNMVERITFFRRCDELLGPGKGDDVEEGEKDAAKENA